MYLICGCRWVCVAEIILIQMIWTLRSKAHSKYIHGLRSGSIPRGGIKWSSVLSFSNIYEVLICAWGCTKCYVKQGKHMQTWALLIRNICNLRQASILEYIAREPDLKCMFCLQGRQYKVHHHKYVNEGNSYSSPLSLLCVSSYHYFLIQALFMKDLLYPRHDLLPW